MKVKYEFDYTNMTEKQWEIAKAFTESKSNNLKLSRPATIEEKKAVIATSIFSSFDLFENQYSRVSNFEDKYLIVEGIRVDTFFKIIKEQNEQEADTEEEE